MALTANVEQVIAVGRSQLGYSESPRGSNRTKYGQFYGLNGAPWCAIFVSWVFYHAGSPLKISTTKGWYRVWETDRKSTRLNSSHITRSRMPSSA